MAENLPISESAAFEEWIRIKPRDLRTLQKILSHRYKQKIDMRVLTRWAMKHQWVERAYQIDLMAEAEINQMAFETIAGKMVRRRAESMELLGESFDNLVRYQAEMVRAEAFKLNFKVGSPDVLLKTLACMEKIGKIYQSMMPMAPQRPEEGVEPNEAEALMDGSIDPLRVAEQLIALSRKPKLIDLKANKTAVHGVSAPCRGFD